jgi:hypothetical protein
MAESRRAGKAGVSQRKLVSVSQTPAPEQPEELERLLEYRLENRNDPKKAAIQTGGPLSNFPRDKTRVHFGEDRQEETS